MKTQARIIAAAALLAGPVVYLTAEAISAAAWKNPTYSYTRDWLSDLGSTTRGVFQSRLIDSPLHTVMNTGFILQGILYAAGTIALSRLLSGKLRTATAAIGGGVGLGYLLLGIFQGSQDAADNGSLAWHFTGAGIAIIGANVLALILGLHWWKNPETRGLGHASVPLGALGILATIALRATFNTAAPSGLIERIAVYPIALWQIRVALELLLRRQNIHTAAPHHALTRSRATRNRKHS